MPTSLVRDLPDNAGEDSESFFNALRSGDKFEHAPLVHHGAQGHFAIRDGRWKLLITKKGEELYDLVEDLEETTNLIGAHPEVAKGLKARLREIVANGRSSPGEVQPNEGGTDYESWCRGCGQKNRK